MRHTSEDRSEKLLFQQLSVKGEGEKLVAKREGRIQRGLSSFSVN